MKKKYNNFNQIFKFIKVQKSKAGKRQKIGDILDLNLPPSLTTNP